MTDDIFSRELFDIVDLCVIVTDFQGHILEMNKSAKLFTNSEKKDPEVIFAVIPSLRAIWNEIIISEGNKEFKTIKNDNYGFYEDMLASLPMKVMMSGNIGCNSQVSVYKSASGEHFYVLFSYNKFYMDSDSSSVPLVMDEAQYMSILGNIPGIIYRCMLDYSWTMLFISDYVEELTGYPPEDFIGNASLTFADSIHPDDRAYVEEIVSKAVDNNDHFNIEYRMVHQDGTVRWVRERGKLGGNFQTGNRYLDGYIFDITELKEAQAKCSE